MATILLTGATGTISSGAIRELQQKGGHTLIGLVRDASSDKAKALAAQGVELRTGDLEKLRTVEKAFEGVDVAWLLSKPGLMAPAQQSNALQGARLGKVKHVVRMSAVGAAHDAPTINSRLHALSDSEVAASGIPYTIVKPHAFLQNLMMSAKMIAEQGMLFGALGDTAQPMIDTRDVSASVAAILANPGPHAGKTYTLTGPTAVTYGQIASAIGEAIGKPVKYVAIPVATMVENLTKFGIDDYNQTAIRDYMTAYASGWSSKVTTSVQDLTGKPARSIHDFARDFAGVFGKR